MEYRDGLEVWGGAVPCDDAARQAGLDKATADAKAEALKGSDLKSCAAPAWQHSEGGLSILPRWHRRSAEASDSDESFNDSAQGETPRGESAV